MKFEYSLPDDARIQSYLVENRAEMLTEFADIRNKHLGGDFIDSDTEFFNTRELEQNQNIVKFLEAKVFAGAAEYDSANFEEMGRATVYRAVLFSKQVVEAIYGQYFSVDVNSYLNELRGYTSEYAFKIFACDSSDYLSKNQGIGDFITWFSDEIDESRGYSYYAELTASMVFMLAEQKMDDMYTGENDTGTLDGIAFD